MANKFGNYLIWTLLILVMLGIIWLFIEPIIWWTPYSEIRLCVRLFLLMFAVSTFSTLRLYNSIVQNTRFSIKLRETLNSFQQVIPSLERSIKSLNNSIGSLRNSVDSLKENVVDNTDEVKKFTDKVKSNK